MSLGITFNDRHLDRRRPRHSLKVAGSPRWICLMPATSSVAICPIPKLAGWSGPPPARRSAQVADDRGSCKGLLPHCRRIVICLRSGIKGDCDRRTASTGTGARSTYTRSRPLTAPSGEWGGSSQSDGEGAAHKDHGPGPGRWPGTDMSRG